MSAARSMHGQRHTKVVVVWVAIERSTGRETRLVKVLVHVEAKGLWKAAGLPPRVHGFTSRGTISRVICVHWANEQVSERGPLDVKEKKRKTVFELRPTFALPEQNPFMQHGLILSRTGGVS